jgi:hypothetical protein
MFKTVEYYNSNKDESIQILSKISSLSDKQIKEELYGYTFSSYDESKQYLQNDALKESEAISKRFVESGDIIASPDLSKGIDKTFIGIIYS